MNIGSRFRSIPPVTKQLLIINVIVWLGLQFFHQNALIRFENICALHYFSSANFQPWQVITYMFVHVDFIHLLFNMFALYMFGTVVESIFGWRRFLFYYLACGIGAALVQEGVFALMINHTAPSLPEHMSVADVAAFRVGDPIFGTPSQVEAIRRIWGLVNTPVIGASGAVFGILLAFGFLLPRAPLYLFFIPVPIQARWVVIGYGAIELFMGFANESSQVAHFAHLGGMLFGLLMLLYWRKKGTLHAGPF